MSNESRLLLLDAKTVDQLLVPDDVLQAVREAFELHSQREGRVFTVIREKLDTGGIFGIKAGDVQSQSLLGFKAAGFWPSNRAQGSEPHQATILLIDPSTGRPHCVIDGNAITTVRTGAAGALGLQTLARPNSKRITIFGTGVQARSQLSFALRTLKNINHVSYLSFDHKPDLAFEGHFAKQCILVCEPDGNAAVNQADVVITATPGGGALFDLQAVRTGTHFNCVGADTSGKRELPEGLLQKAKTVVVDDKPQALQLGEMQWAPDVLCTELGDLLVNRAQFKRADSDITVFDMTGLALQDLTVARQIFTKAGASHLGISVAWPW